MSWTFYDEHGNRITTVLVPSCNYSCSLAITNFAYDLYSSQLQRTLTIKVTNLRNSNVTWDLGKVHIQCGIKPEYRPITDEDGNIKYEPILDVSYYVDQNFDPDNSKIEYSDAWNCYMLDLWTVDNPGQNSTIELTIKNVIPVYTIDSFGLGTICFISTKSYYLPLGTPNDWSHVYHWDDVKVEMKYEVTDPMNFFSKPLQFENEVILGDEHPDRVGTSYAWVLDHSELQQIPGDWLRDILSKCPKVLSYLDLDFYQYALDVDGLTYETYVLQKVIEVDESGAEFETTKPVLVSKTLKMNVYFVDVLNATNYQQLKLILADILKQHISSLTAMGNGRALLLLCFSHGEYTNSSSSICVLPLLLIPYPLKFSISYVTVDYCIDLPENTTSDVLCPGYIPRCEISGPYIKDVEKNFKSIHTLSIPVCPNVTWDFEVGYFEGSITSHFSLDFSIEDKVTLNSDDNLEFSYIANCNVYKANTVSIDDCPDDITTVPTPPINGLGDLANLGDLGDLGDLGNLNLGDLDIPTENFYFIEINGKDSYSWRCDDKAEFDITVKRSDGWQLQPSQYTLTVECDYTNYTIDSSQSKIVFTLPQENATIEFKVIAKITYENDKEAEGYGYFTVSEWGDRILMVEVSTDKQYYDYGSTNPAQITVKVYDLYGNPISGLIIEDNWSNTYTDNGNGTYTTSLDISTLPTGLYQIYVKVNPNGQCYKSNLTDYTIIDTFTYNTSNHPNQTFKLTYPLVEELHVSVNGTETTNYTTRLNQYGELEVTINDTLNEGDNVRFEYKAYITSTPFYIGASRPIVCTRTDEVSISRFGRTPTMKIVIPFLQSQEEACEIAMQYLQYYARPQKIININNKF